MSAIDNLQDRFVWKTFDEMPPAGNSRLFDALGHSGRAGQFAGGGRPQSETSADKTAEQELTKSIETANTYLEGDYAAQAGPDSEDFPLAEAILGALVLRQKIAEGATQELIDLELALADAIKRDAGSSFLTPNIQVVPNGQIVEDANGNIVIELENGEVGTSDDYPDVLPMDANGAFVPGEDGAPGTILISDVFINEDGHVVDDPEVLSDVVLEEFGEALADHVKTLGFGEGPGDVGNRLMKVFTGEDLTGADFEEDPARDTRDVLFGGAIAQGAKASAEVEGTVDGEGDQPAVQMTTPVAAATTNNALTPPSEEAVAQVERLHGGPPFTEASYPNVEDWDLVVDTYGTVNAGSLTINELAQAIDDGAVDVKNTGTEDADGKDMIVDRVDETKFTHADGMARSFADYAGIWGITPTDDTVPADFVESAYNSAISLYESSGHNLDPWYSEGLDASSSDLDGWGQLLTIYGQPKHTIGTENEVGLVMQLDDVTRAIADGALGVRMLGATAADGFEIGSVNLSAVSNTALTDAMWRYTERQSGHHRVQMGGQLLAESVAAITGDPDGFDQSNTEQLDAIFDNFGDVPHGDDFRLSKDALQNIWDSGAFERLDSTGNVIAFEVDVAAAGTGGTPSEPTDPDDPGLVGQGRAAYGLPEGANVFSVTSLLAHQNQTGRDIHRAMYVLPEAPDEVVVVDINADEGSKGLVYQAVKVNTKTEDVVAYDAAGELIAEFNAGPDGMDIQYELVETTKSDGQAELASLQEWATTNGFVIDDEFATSETSLITYKGDDGGSHVAYINIDQNDAGEWVPSEVFTAPFESEQAEAQISAVLLAMDADKTFEQDAAGSDRRRLSLLVPSAYAGTEIAKFAIEAGVGAGTAGGAAFSYAMGASLLGATIAALNGVRMGHNTGVEMEARLEKQRAAMFGVPDYEETGDMMPAVGSVPIDNSVWQDDDTVESAEVFDIEEEVNPGIYEEVYDSSVDFPSLGEPPAHYNDSDLGVLGLDRPAYFRPLDAELVSSVLVPAEDGPYGVLTEQFTYTRPGELDTVYVVSVDRSDPGGARDGLVLHGTKTVYREETDGTTLSNVTSYDSFGTVTETVNDLDLEAQVGTMTEDELLGYPDENIVHIEEQIYEFQPDAIILETHSSGPLAYGTYKIPGEVGIKTYMVERIEGEDGGHSYEEADEWLSSTVTETFFSAFNYLQMAVNTYQQLKRYYAVGVLTQDVFNYLSDYFLQDVNFPGIATSMFAASGTGAGGLPPSQAATVRHVGAAAAAIPLIQRGVALTIDQMWATRGGASNIGMAMMNVDMADGQQDGAGLQGENGDIVAPAAADLPGPATPPTPPIDMEIEGTELLIASTNPGDHCTGAAHSYLVNRIEVDNTLSSGDASDIRIDAIDAAPIENGKPNQAAIDATNVQFGVQDKINENLDHFTEMVDPEELDVVDITMPDGQTDQSADRSMDRYTMAVTAAKSGLDVKFSPSTTEISDVLTVINENPGRAFELSISPYGANNSQIGSGHAKSIVKESDGSITIMDADDGLLRFAPDDAALSAFLASGSQPEGVVESVFQLMEVRSTNEANNGMTVKADDILWEYDHLPYEADVPDEDETTSDEDETTSDEEL